MNTFLQDKLAAVSRTVNLWKAELALLRWAAGLAVLLCALSVSDFLLRYGRTGRLVAGGAFFGLMAAAALHLLLIARRRRSGSATAALLEQGFPQLDNHLINYVQLAADTDDSSPLRQAYLTSGAPDWSGLDLRKLRDRRAYLRGYGAALAGALLLAVPFFWVGYAWPIAILRILNPLSARLPATLVTLVSVQPGDVSIMRGDALVLSCEARGYRGQKVEVDLWPDDDAHASILMGTLTGQGTESFSYRLPKVTANTRYRIRAGDALPSHTFKIKACAPLALHSLSVTITPPDYTRLPHARTNVLEARLNVPQYSRADFELRCNRPLVEGSLGVGAGAPLALHSADQGVTWNGGLLVESGSVFRVIARDPDGGTLTNELAFDLVPDKAPVIRVVAPTGRTILAAGASPAIQFEVKDDFGLGRIALQRVTRGGERAVQEGETVKDWPVSDLKTFSAEWRGDFTDVPAGTEFRVVALDNRRPGTPHKAISGPILFDPAPASALVQQDKQAATSAGLSLARLVDMQRSNLTATARLNTAPATATAQEWKGTLSLQTEIRQIAATLLSDAQRPLGSLTATLKQAFDGPMTLAIDFLDRASKAETEARAPLSRQAVEQESIILRMLTQIETGLAKVQQHQSVTGLLALLDSLVKGQQATLEQTQAGLKTGARSKLLVKHQDALAGDVAEFVQLCRSGNPSQETSDAEFAKLARQAADLADSRHVRTDMLTASEHLEANRLAEAVPVESQALASLQEIQKMLNQWRTLEAQRKTEQLRDLLDNARTSLEKMVAVQAKVVDAIRATETQKDQSTKDDPLVLENQELKSEMSEAALSLANDLQALPELPAMNQLVNDVSQIYEEMKQIAGSDKTEATELGLQKEDWLAEGLGKALGKVDDMEMWLMPAPDAVKRNTETFDKQELPVIADATLGAPLEDIISDLLEQEEDIRDKSDDSTGNQGVPDMPAGWAVAEGETTSYGAKGKSGNERPEHKDQDGRSNVGRAGMSDGEIAAGSGKINEGDKNIEKRMTRDSSQGGSVKEDDHAQAKATGGGKLSGFGEEKGMAGMGPRRDSNEETPSELGRQALLRRQADAVYARAALQHLRTGSMDKAIQHMRQAEDAMNSGMPIRQVREFQRRAAIALKQTRTELNSGFAETPPLDAQVERTSDDQVASTSDEAPAKYRGLVSDYFKKLSEQQ